VPNTSRPTNHPTASGAAVPRIEGIRSPSALNSLGVSCRGCASDWAPLTSEQPELTPAAATTQARRPALLKRGANPPLSYWSTKPCRHCNSNGPPPTQGVFIPPQPSVRLFNGLTPACPHRARDPPPGLCHHQVFVTRAAQAQPPWASSFAASTAFERCPPWA